MVSEPHIVDVLLTVDYTLSAKRLIVAGKYDFVNSDIDPANVTTVRSGRHNLVASVVLYDSFVSSSNALALLPESLRAGEPYEALSIGIEIPELQRDFAIVALGPGLRCNGSDQGYVMALDAWGKLRKLSLRSFETVWGPSHGFLAFRV